MDIIESVRHALEQVPLVLFILRVIVATLCGAAIGLERTKRSKEAGIRTHCIIACASALFMIISQHGFTLLSNSTPPVLLRRWSAAFPSSAPA